MCPGVARLPPLRHPYLEGENGIFHFCVLIIPSLCRIAVAFLLIRVLISWHGMACQANLRLMLRAQDLSPARACGPNRVEWPRATTKSVLSNFVSHRAVNGDTRKSGQAPAPHAKVVPGAVPIVRIPRALHASRPPRNQTEGGEAGLRAGCCTHDDRGPPRPVPSREDLGWVLLLSNTEIHSPRKGPCCSHRGAGIGAAGGRALHTRVCPGTTGGGVERDKIDGTNLEALPRTK